MSRRTAVLGAITAVTGAASLAPVISAAIADSGGTTVQSPFTNTAIPLRAMPHATAQFFRSFGGDLSVRLSVIGVTPGSRHSVDVERGLCPAGVRPGADLAQPAAVQANAAGQIDQTIDLGSAERLAHGPLALTLRQGVTAPSAGSSPLAVQGLACTQVPRYVGFRGNWRDLQPASESGLPLRGWASYAYSADNPQSSSGQSVTVTIKASGFIPGSVHAVHVHSGTCTNQGNVVVMLPDLTANSAGDISATDTVPVNQPPQGSLYVNIHEGNSNTILSADGTPTLAFRPLLCGDVSQAQTAHHLW